MPTIGLTRDPRISEGFSALAQAMFPSPLDIARAGLMGAQRDYYGAQTTRQEAETDQIRMGTDARDAYSRIIANPDFQSDPRLRAKAQGVASRIHETGYQHGPQAVTRAAVVNNPDAFTPTQLATILTTQGTPYGSTQAGFEATQTHRANQLEQRLEEIRLRGDNELARERVRSDERIRQVQEGVGQRETRLNRLNTQELGRVSETLTTRVRDRLADLGLAGRDETVSLETGYQDRLLGMVSEGIAKHGNTERAIQQAIAANPPDNHYENTSSWVPFTARTGRVRATPTGSRPPPAAAAGGEQPQAGQPQAPRGQSAGGTRIPAGNTREGALVMGPDGRRYIARGGFLEPLANDAR